MLCPKCKTELSDKVLRCPSCGVKVRSRCPACGAINKANALSCLSCSHELLKKCSTCNAYNLPTVAACRKCGTAFAAASSQYIQDTDARIDALESIIQEQETTKTTQQTEVKQSASVKEDKGSLEDDESVRDLEQAPNSSTRAFSEQEVPDTPPCEEKDQLEVKNQVVNSLLNSEKILCSLTSAEGNGKSYVLSFVTQDLMSAKSVVLPVEATPITQLSPFGIFQDLLLMSSGLPNYFVEGQQSEQELIKLIEKSFGMTSDDASNLFNFFYPAKNSFYEEILHNKERTKDLIKKTFANVKARGECILTIDDFDLIDATSFELLVEMYKEGYIDENFKLFVTAQNQKNIDMFLQLTGMPHEKYEKVCMGALDAENTASLMKNILNGYEPMTPALSQKIIDASMGSPAFVGQVLLYMNESGLFNLEGDRLICLADENTFTPPSDITAVLQKRLEVLKETSFIAYKALVYLSMLGVKFDILMLNAVMGLEQADFEELLQYLQGSAFIVPCGNQWFKFQNTLIWKCLFSLVKQDEIFPQCATDLLNALMPLRLTNYAYKPLLAKHSKNSQLAFDAWTDALKKSAFIGDVNLYVLAQKQCLKLLEDVENVDKAVVDNNIKLRLGRLLCVAEPELALEFLSGVLGVNLEKNDITDFIDVASNAVIAANNAGNYNAVIELVDNVVKLLDPSKYKLEIALIATRKVKTMLYLGNYEQLLNVIENDINPHLEDALAQNYTVYNLPISKIFETWLETNLVLAEALILQGNNKVYDIIATIEDALKSHVEELVEYALKLKLLKAFAASMKGEVVSSDRLIIEITEEASHTSISGDFFCRLNLLQVLNCFLRQDVSSMKGYLFELVTFANNNGDYLGKNLLKTALGRIFENEGDFSKAFEIYNDQITYFAKERIAVGALLAWYLIADLCLRVSDNDKALEVATNALDVAKNPKINSYYFQVMYKRLIAEIYLNKGDYDATKMYLDKSLLITKKFNLEYLNIWLYDFYAKYHIEMFKTGRDNGSSPLVSAKKLYEKAVTIASRLGLLNIVEEEKKEYQSLLTFAQLKKVSLV